MRETSRLRLHCRALFCLIIELYLGLFVIAYGVNITSTTKTYYAENGGAINVLNNVTATDRGISRTTSAPGVVNNSCELNVTFTGNPGRANTTITPNDFVYTVEIGTTSLTPASHCFQVSLKITPDRGNPTTGTVYIATGPSVVENQTIDCQFDIGANLPLSPYSFIVTVE